MPRPIGTGGIAKSLTREEISRLDRYLRRQPHAARNVALVYLCLGTGMRIGEAAQLKLGDVWNGSEPLAEISLERSRTKGKRSRTVAVAPFAQVALADYLSTRPEATPEQPLFPGSDPSRPLRRDYLVSAVRAWLRGAGIPNAKSHSFRRTHADMLRRSGVDLHIIQKQLGHASLAMTERYFAIDPAEIQQAVNRLEL